MTVVTLGCRQGLDQAGSAARHAEACLVPHAHVPGHGQEGGGMLLGKPCGSAVVPGSSTIGQQSRSRSCMCKAAVTSLCSGVDQKFSLTYAAFGHYDQACSCQRDSSDSFASI